MDLQIELYTTPTVEGRKILSSKGFVCANIVLGAGVIYYAHKETSELPAHFYVDGVEPYHVELFDALEREVLNKGGNAVIDLHIEHNYVKCGQYDYSLLISAQGTAVELEGIEISGNRNIKGKVLEQQFRNKQIRAKLTKWNDGNQGLLKLDIKEWIFIREYADLSYADILYKAYIKNALSVPNDAKKDQYYSCDNCIYRREFYSYFKQLPYEKQIELAYTFCDWKSSDLVVQCDLFDSKRILEWAQKGEFEFATECLKAQKKEYSAQDLEDMQKLYDFFTNLPEKAGSIEEKCDKYNRTWRMFVCKQCNCESTLTSYDKDISYCPMCKKGKKGLTKEQEEMVKEFGIKIEALKELLSNIGK